MSSVTNRKERKVQRKGGEAKSAVRLGRPRDETVHTAIMAAAVDVLGEKGYGTFSIEGVAARAGVAKQSIYRRWPSKGALLLDIYMEGMTGDGMTVPSGKGVEADFCAYIGQTIRRLKDVAWMNTLRSVVAEAQTDPRLRTLVFEKVVGPRREIGRRLLQAAVASGELDRDFDVEIFLDLVFGAVWYRLLLGHAPIDKQFADRMLKRLFAHARAVE
jgi:AcrR family transcriptional regulator